MRRFIIMILISLIGLQARSETFSCTLHDAVITATDTSIVCVMDREEIEMDLPEGMVLRGIDAFGEGIVAIAEGGNILFWDSPFDKARRVRFEITGEFVGLDTSEDRCFAVSDSSEILSLNLALQGKIFDFNASYSEYYGTVSLIDVAVGPTAVFVAAVREDGSPAAFTSSKGSVWSERDLDYAINGKWHMFKKIPHRITYEELSDTFALHCEDGTELHLPACSHCNYVIEPTSL